MNVIRETFKEIQIKKEIWIKIETQAISLMEVNFTQTNQQGLAYLVYLVVKQVFNINRSSRPKMFCKKKVFLKISQNSQETTCARVSACSFIKNETLAHKFSYEFCEILRTPIFTEHHRWPFLDKDKSSTNSDCKPKLKSVINLHFQQFFSSSKKIA